MCNISCEILLKQFDTVYKSEGTYRIILCIFDQTDSRFTISKRHSALSNGPTVKGKEPDVLQNIAFLAACITVYKTLHLTYKYFKECDCQHSEKDRNAQKSKKNALVAKFLSINFHFL